MTVQQLDETYRILIASPEVAPIRENRGAVQCSRLTPKPCNNGNDVRVVMPKYRGSLTIRH